MNSPPAAAAPSWPPFPIPIVHHQLVYDLAEETPGTVVGITEAYCIYRAQYSEQLAVARWNSIALANLCPAAQLLPRDVAVRDHHNASAALLRELIALRQVSLLTPHQQAVFNELVELLCPV